MTNKIDQESGVRIGPGNALPSLKNYTILSSEVAIYREAEAMIRSLLKSQTTRSSDVRVTALVRQETKGSNASIGGYISALNDLLESEAIDDDVSYNMLGSFGQLHKIGDSRVLFNFEESLAERMALFTSEKARSRVNIKSFNEIWPVDVLVVKDDAIIAFRDHDRGGLRWGLKVADPIVASKVLNWLEDLWEDEHKTIYLVKHGLQVHPGADKK